jgi:hypothetical protein
MNLVLLLALVLLAAAEQMATACHEQSARGL